MEVRCFHFSYIFYTFPAPSTAAHCPHLFHFSIALSLSHTHFSSFHSNVEEHGSRQCEHKVCEQDCHKQDSAVNQV